MPTQTALPTGTSTPTAASTTTSTPSVGQTQTITLPIGVGWNLIALPVSPTLPLQAQNVLTSVVVSSGGSIAELAAWQGNSWTTVLDNGGNLQGTMFLALGQGYFMYTDQAASLPVSGISMTVAPTVTLAAGWNLIGLPTVSDGQKAHALLASLTAAGLAPLEAANWVGNTWQTLEQIALGSYRGDDFSLSPTQGYFVYVQNAGSWRAQAP